MEKTYRLKNYINFAMVYCKFTSQSVISHQLNAGQDSEESLVITKTSKGALLLRNLKL